MIELDKEASLKIDVVNGVEGPSIYFNDTRVAGPKPWGGGKVLYSIKAKRQHILDASGATAELRRQAERIKALEATITDAIKSGEWMTSKTDDTLVKEAIALIVDPLSRALLEPVKEASE